MNHILSILFQKDGFSFCVIKDGKIKHFSEVTLDANSPSDDEDALYTAMSRELHFQQKYDRVVASGLNQQFNLVPKLMLDYTGKEQWLEFNAPIYEGDSVKSATLFNDEVELVYSNDLLWENTLRRFYPNFEWNHASVVFLNSLTEVDESAQVFINVHNSSFEVAAFNDQQIQLYNLFSYATKEDFLYYLLNVMQQLEMDTETTPVYYFGQLTTDSPLFTMIFKYIRHIMPGTSTVDLLKHYTLIQQIS